MDTSIATPNSDHPFLRPDEQGKGVFKINDFTLNTSFEQLIAQQIVPFLDKIVEEPGQSYVTEVTLDSGSKPFVFGQEASGDFQLEYNLQQIES